MNRRSFLAALAAMACADPERMLWTPGAKLISIPKPKALQSLVFLESNANGAGDYYRKAWLWQNYCRSPENALWKQTSPIGQEIKKFYASMDLLTNNQLDVAEWPLRSWSGAPNVKP